MACLRLARSSCFDFPVTPTAIVLKAKAGSAGRLPGSDCDSDHGRFPRDPRREANQVELAGEQPDIGQEDVPRTTVAGPRMLGDHRAMDAG